MIPAFPEFKHVEVRDKEAVEIHTHRFEPYSDFNFTSLYAWDTNDERMLSELHGNLVVRFTDYATREPFLSFLGTNETEHTARTLLEYSKENSLPLALKFLPEISTKDIRPSVLTVEEDRDNFDYIYSIPALSSLKGGELKPRRNFVNGFIKEHPDILVEAIDLADREAQRTILTLLDTWEKNKILTEKAHEIEHEKTALKRLFETAGSHALTALGVFFQNQLLAFSIDEALPDQYCIGHFWKGDFSHKGIYDYLIQKKAQHFEAQGLSLWNYEQDLGVEGLRRSKLSYKPVHFLKKYIIKMAN